MTMFLSAKSVHRFPEFFSDEQFREIQSYIDRLLRKHPQQRSIKKSDTGLTAREIINQSRYASYFDKMGIDYEKSYINIGCINTQNAESEKNWHFDHSEYTLIVPIFLSGTRKGTIYSVFLSRDKGILKYITKIINRFLILLAVREEEFEINKGFIIPGTKLYHTSPRIERNATRVILVAHLSTLGQI